MAAVRAWCNGLGRILRAPVLLAGIYAITLGLTVPLGVALHAGLPAPVDGPTADGEPAVPDLDWLEEVTARATGLKATLAPSVIGVAAPLTNLGALLDGRRPAATTVAMSIIYFVLWAALWGGVIRRLAGNRALGWREFSAASGRSWSLLLRLGTVALAAYLVLFLTVHALLFGPIYESVTNGVLERTAVAWRAGLSVVFVALLAWISQVFDFARIDAVLSENRAVTIALRRGATFVRRHAAASSVLVVVNGLAFAGLLTLYGAVEFVPGGSVPGLTRILLIGQAYIVARLALRLLLAAAQVSLYQSKAGAT